MKNNCFVARSGAFVRAASLVLAAVLAGCASNTPAPVAERTLAPVKSAAPAPAKDTYTVKSGDTLYSIAREQGMDFRELIALNGIENPNQISVGRVLKVKPKGGAAATSEVATTAPVTSDVVVARPIGGEPAIEQKPLPGGGNTDTLKREPKAGKVPYSDQALAQAQGAAAPAKPADSAPTAAPAKPDEKPAEAPASEGDWQWPADGKIIATFSDSGGKGIDIAGKAGDPVVAAVGGKVLIAKSHNDDSLRRYGNMVIIQNPNGIITVYAHNSKLLVKEGQTVSKGQKIAEVGNSGTDQVKLHFEVRSQGKPLDPLKYLPQR